MTLCISTKLCCVLCNAMHFYQAVHCAVCCATLCISTKLCSVLCNAVHFYQAQKVVLCRSEVPAGGGGGGWRLEGGLKFSPRFPTKMHREVMEVEEMHSGEESSASGASSLWWPPPRQPWHASHFGSLPDISSPEMHRAIPHGIQTSKKLICKKYSVCMFSFLPPLTMEAVSLKCPLCAFHSHPSIPA